MRWLFWRTAKVPKEDSFTVSPLASAPQTSSSISSTIWAESVRERPTAWKTDSVRSARVKVPVAMAPATPIYPQKPRAGRKARQYQLDRPQNLIFRTQADPGVGLREGFCGLTRSEERCGHFAHERRATPSGRKRPAPATTGAGRRPR